MCKLNRLQPQRFFTVRSVFRLCVDVLNTRFIISSIKPPFNGQPHTGTRSKLNSHLQYHLTLKPGPAGQTSISHTHLAGSSNTQGLPYCLAKKEQKTQLTCYTAACPFLFLLRHLPAIPLPPNIPSLIFPLPNVPVSTLQPPLFHTSARPNNTSYVIFGARNLQLYARCDPQDISGIEGSFCSFKAISLLEYLPQRRNADSESSIDIYQSTDIQVAQDRGLHPRLLVSSGGENSEKSDQETVQRVKAH